MISCIICSRTPEISIQQRENIEKTIGVEYEIVVIDNSRNTYTIFSAYNEGVKRAVGDILCFMHDDIIFETNEWGIQVEQILKQTEFGAVGVAGTHYLPNSPCYWKDCCITVGFFNLNGVLYDWQSTKERKDFYTVCALDGMFLCIKSELFKKGYIQFDEKTFNGFHYYDMDICMQIVTQRYDVAITKRILIKHNSIANYNKKFYENQNKFYDKWEKEFPIIKGISQDEAINWAIYKYRNLDTKYSDLLYSKTYRLGCYVQYPKLLFKRLIQGKSFNVLRHCKISK